MKTIYLVQGSTGDYEDYNDWVFGAYVSEQSAKDKVQQLNDWLKENHAHIEYSSYESCLKIMEREDRLDPELQCYPTTGSVYGYYSISLLDG